MKTELKRSSPLKQGVSPEYIINFLNACEKADSEIHGIMIARNNEVIFEAYNAPYAADIQHIMRILNRLSRIGLKNTMIGALMKA